MNAKQQRFCDEYLIDLNATQAAIRAGYSAKTAGQIAEKMLKIAELRAYVDEKKAARAKRTEITSDYVLTGLQEVAERCLQKIPVMEFDYNYKTRTLVQKTDEEGNGIWEFDSTGANRAFELLGKHVGVFERDNSQKKPDQAPMTDKQVDRLIEALRKK